MNDWSRALPARRAWTSAFSKASARAPHCAAIQCTSASRHHAFARPSSSPSWSNTEIASSAVLRRASVPRPGFSRPWIVACSSLARSSSLRSPAAAAPSIARERIASALTSSPRSKSALPSSGANSSRALSSSRRRSVARVSSPAAAGASPRASARRPADASRSAAFVAIGTDQILADERREQLVEGRSFRQQCSDVFSGEELADHGGTLEDAALTEGQLIEAGGEESLDRRRGLHVGKLVHRAPTPVFPLKATTVDEHGEHLLDEERVALARGHELRDALGGRLAEQVPDQPLDLVVPQRLEQDRSRVDLPTAPCGALVEELGPREADKEDRRVARPVGEVLDEVEERRLGPLHVVERHYDRSLLRQRFDQLPHRPERLLVRGVALPEAGGGCEPVDDDLGLGLACEERGQLRASVLRRVAWADRGGLADELRERPEGDALAVGHAAAHQDARLFAELREELVHEPRLPDARRAEDREEMAGVLVDGPPESLLKEGELALSADERRVEPPSERGRAGDDSEQAPRVDRLRLSLQGQRLDRLGEYGIPYESVRRVADQDLAGARRRREPLRQGDRVPGGKGLPLGRIAGDDLAGVDSRADGELDPVLAAQLFVQAPERLAQLRGRPDCAQSVVFVHDRDPEDGHHGVADELLDGATVALEHEAHLDEVARDDAAVGLGVELLAERGRVDDVREDDRHGLPHLARGGGLLQGRATGAAESRARGVRLATAGTGGHVLSECRT